MSQHRSVPLRLASCGLCSVRLDLYGWTNSVYYPVCSALWVVLWLDSLVSYVISVYWMFSPLHSIFYVFIQQETYPVILCFMCLQWPFIQVFSLSIYVQMLLASCKHTLQDKATLAATVTAHQLWGHWLTDWFDHFTFLLPLGCLIFIAAMFKDNNIVPLVYYS